MALLFARPRGRCWNHCTYLDVAVLISLLVFYDPPVTQRRVRVSSTTRHTIVMKPYQILPGALLVITMLFSSVSVASAQTDGTGAGPACFSPVVNMRYGADDTTTTGEVTSLQQYLVTQGFFDSVNMGTGHFGPITRKAVIAFQSANGVPATGYVGPLTRAFIQRHCSPNSFPTDTPLSATPTSGSAPLSVDFSGSGLTGGNQYVIEYGDGSNSGALDAVNVCMGTLNNPAGCPRVHSTHTYTSSGTYTATLERYIGCMWSEPRCMIATMPIGTVVIQVGTGSQQTLSISGLDAPTTLALGQQGTWTVRVLTDSGSGNLHYSVLWGNEQYATSGANIMAPQPTTISTSGTFTHSYGRAGTYAPAFTVTDDSGSSAHTATSIVVAPLY
ncbi:MAG: peptidoglycan-binding protein [Patescibacteria group bacterium]